MSTNMPVNNYANESNCNEGDSAIQRYIKNFQNKQPEKGFCWKKYGC